MNDLRLSSQDPAMAPFQDLDLTCGLSQAPQLLTTCTTALTLFCLSLGSAFRKGHQESGAQAADLAVGVAEGASPQTASISTARGRRPGLETQSSHAGSPIPPLLHPNISGPLPVQDMPSLSISSPAVSPWTKASWLGSPLTTLLPSQQTLRGPLTGRR